MKKSKREPYVIVTGDWLRVVLEPHGPWNRGQLALLSNALGAPPSARLSWFVGREISVELAAQIEDLPYAK